MYIEVFSLVNWKYIYSNKPVSVVVAVVVWLIVVNVVGGIIACY